MAYLFVAKKTFMLHTGRQINKGANLPKGRGVQLYRSKRGTLFVRASSHEA